MPKMIDKIYDVLGVVGFFIAALTAWFNQWVANFDIGMKIITILGGFLLLLMSIIHKHIQIKNEKAKKLLEELRQKQEKMLTKLEDKVKDDSESNR